MPKRSMPAPRSAKRHERTAREQAIEHLLRIEEGAYIGLLDAETGDPRKARQATEYVAGVTRWRRWLDFVLAHFYRGAYATIDPPLRQVLRLGAYEILFLRTPEHAAVNEAVRLAKRLVSRGAGGLTNGILRTIIRRRDDLPAPDGDEAERLAITHSHPTWMVRRWLRRYGPADTEALLGWNNTSPSHTLRVNTLRTDPERVREALAVEGLEAAPSPHLPYLLSVERLQPVLRSGLLERGEVAVQDESAALVTLLLDPQPGETVVDSCAAPGGKALHAAQRMGNEGRILALDLHERRLGLVRQAAEAQGVSIVETWAGDVRQTEPDRRADRVLVDAPCSGLGVLSKRADLRWQRSPDDLSELAELQGELLDGASRWVRPGGVLVYSTCTIEPEENEQVVEGFLARTPGFTREPAAEHLPSALCTADGYYATFPPRDCMDGAFGARLRSDG